MICEPVVNLLTPIHSKAQELYQMIEGQNTTLCKLQEIAHRSRLAQCKVRPNASVVVGTLIQNLFFFF